ncbi:MAG: hypothetical protein WCI05_18490, partial [Myxococcales bacterium]
MVWSTRFEAYAGGQKAPRGGLDGGGLDADALGAVLREYRRTVAKRYRVLSADLIERALPAGSLWISSKLDGELWFLVKRAGQVALCAYNGRVLVGTPLVKEAERWLKAQGDLVIAGELVAVPEEGRPRVQHVATALGRSEGEKSLSFFAFDLVQAEGKSAFGTPYAERMATLEKLFCKGERIQVVLTVRGESSDAASYYREWVGTQRFEGIVVRSDVGLTYKIKPMFSLDAVLVAYGARVTSGVAELREMSVALRRDDGSLQLLGSVGGGFAAGDRVAWYQRLMAMEVKSAFRMANRDGTLCRFVRPEIVV